VAKSPFASTRNKWILLTGVLIWSQMHFIMLTKEGFDFKTSLIDTIVTNGLLVGIALLILTILQFYRPQKRKYLYLFIWCVALSGLWSAIVRFGLIGIFYGIGTESNEYIDYLNASMNYRFNIAFLVCGCASLLGMFYFNQKELMENEKRRQVTEQSIREAELYKLRQQLQPHFLFNSLNSISALAGNRPEEARKMIHQLSDFLRGTIRKDELQSVTVEEELNQLSLYLEIEKVRFGHRLSTSVNIEEPCRTLELPPMLMQPLVENAIKFGLYDTTEPITITVKVFCIDNMLNIEVTNPFDPDSSMHRQGTGFGISSLQRRLYLLFGRNDLVHSDTHENLFTITVKIPQHDQGNINR
jgi:two-component system, LytTR family, sensor kinase